MTGTMVITTFLTFFVVRYAWHYSWYLCVLATGFFLVIDVAFFSANLLKLMQGGWFPLLLGGIVFTLMSTWHRGSELLREEAHRRATATPLSQYRQGLFSRDPLQVPLTAVFLTTDPNGVPLSLLSNIEHNGVVHERMLFVKVMSREVPYVPLAEQAVVEPMGNDCYRVVVSYGFKDTIDLARSLLACDLRGLLIDPLKISYFISHVNVVAAPREGMWQWRKRLFAAMSRNMGSLAAYLRLAANCVVELGARVEI